MTQSSSGYDIAIVGIGLDVPGARTAAEFWANLRDGVESIRELDAAAMIAAGESPARIAQPDYVPHAALLDGYDHFDAEFFGVSPKDAAVMDPQHRKFLECAWHALEDSGHRAETLGTVGVWAGSGMAGYFAFNVCSNRQLVDETGMFLLRHTGNDKDFLSTRASHIFDLHGPSVNVQTACSTSLVAVHQACQSLLSGECDAALAGGVTIELPQGRGYVYKPNEILSPDGHCRAFDHRSQGTVFGSGAAVVVLRRLADALADGDHVWAVIRGSAINNDGAAKAGYLAPSVEGQAAAVAEAHLVAGVSGDSIDYVECHGTGTPLGDPIEVAALTEAFAQSGSGGRTAIGSVKTNIGHLDTAAGAAGLIKVALSLHNRQIPPSLGYEAPNPVIDFANSPFHVADRLADWPAPDGRPRRAGVNSLGVGGTNAHVVLDEAPPRPAPAPSDWPVQPLVVSGRTRAAQDANAAALAAWLRDNPQAPLADVAFTLQDGRRAFDKRRVLVAADAAEAAALLATGDPRRVFDHDRPAHAPSVAFLFPGGGAQYAGMARDLYETEPVFRDWIDRGLAVLERMTGTDIRAVWLPPAGAEAAADAALQRPSVQLPLIMIVEYALAQLWISWGVIPAALAGHSMGENTAACVAGVIGFEDCIGLVALRGRLFDTVAPGGMLSVPLPPAELMAEAGPDLDLAAVNAPRLSVVSGPQAEIDALQARLAARGIEAQRIAIDVAAHSRMLDPILAEFGAYLRGITLSPPKIPLISNRSGTWMTDAEATDPEYWVGHLRHHVDFAAGIATLREDAERIFLEVGPGRAMASLAQACGVAPGKVVSSLRHPQHEIGDDSWFLTAFARLWAAGLDLDWTPIWGEGRQRLPLPGYVFQSRRYFIEPSSAPAAEAILDAPPMRLADIADWGWRPSWHLSAPDVEIDAAGRPVAAPLRWLVLADQGGLAAQVIARLRGLGHEVIELRAGDGFAQLGPDRFVVAPEDGAAEFEMLVAALTALDRLPDRIASFWLVDDAARQGARPGSSPFHRHLEQGFYSLLHLIRALANEGGGAPVTLSAVTTGAVRVGAEVLTAPEKAMVLGPLAVGPREFPWLSARSIDILPGADEETAACLVEDLLDTAPPARVAWRNGRRLARRLAPVPLPDPAAAFGAGGTVLITGGLGGIATTLARALALDHGARIALLARRPLPPEADWPARIAAAPDHRDSRRLQRILDLRAAGATVEIAAADVADAEALAAAVATLQDRLGPITHLIHAAGSVSDAPILAKTTAEIEDVFAPKVHGLLNLARVFADAPLQGSVLFSSSSTEIGAAGQVDYVAANEFLNAAAAAGWRGLGQVTALDWGVWADVGMAAESLTGAARAPAPDTPVAQPLLTGRAAGPPGAHRFNGRLAITDWIIDEHRTADGVALLPGTGIVELAAEALAAAGRAMPWRIEELSFLNPLVVSPDAPRPFTINLACGESDGTLGIKSGGTPIAEATIIAANPAPPPLDLEAIRARLAVDHAPTGHAIESAQGRQMAFGPRWQVLRATWLGRDEGLAELALPQDVRGDLAQGYLLHPALLDIATGWAMALIPGYDRARLWVPIAYRGFTAHALLPAEVVSHVRYADGGEGYAAFDVTLADPSGVVLAEIEGLTLRRLDGAPAALLAAAEAPPATPLGNAPQLSPGQERLARMVAQGIPAALGPELLARAVATGLGQVAVSSLDLPQLVAQETALSRATAKSDASFERPDLDSDYVAPRTDLERSLAGFFLELLGVQEVGVEDSFFDLGGHSLVAVRLFAMIRKAYGLDLPLATLFQAPTISALAALIETRIGPQGDPAPGAAAAGPGVADAAPRFTHLVAMSGGAAGGGTPLFIVAGMFGNVLNLRALAQRIAPDRPVWGLQARGLFGDAAPHDSFAAAAESCLSEIRQIQPHGPYLLAGFSGGGLTALEIARQLDAAGEAIGRLVMLDTPIPMRPVLSRRDRLLIRAAELREGGLGFLRDWARARWRYARAQRRGGGADDTGGNGPAFHNESIRAAFVAALPGFRMAKWDGPVTLYRPRLDRRFAVSGGRFVSTGREYVFDDNLWSPWLGDLTIEEVPGDHDSMVLEPCVRVLATRMRKTLAEADKGKRR